MSAFIVSTQHINALVTFALDQPSRPYGPAGYYFNNNRIIISERTADLLWQENIRSVQSRYPSDKWADLPGPNKKPKTLKFQRVAQVKVQGFNDAEARLVTIQAADIIGMCDCLDYQSCETDDWQQTEAHAALRAIRELAVKALVAAAKPEIEWAV